MLSASLNKTFPPFLPSFLPSFLSSFLINRMWGSAMNQTQLTIWPRYFKIPPRYAFSLRLWFCRFDLYPLEWRTNDRMNKWINEWMIEYFTIWLCPVFPRREFDILLKPMSIYQNIAAIMPTEISKIRKEKNVLFNDILNAFYMAYSFRLAAIYLLYAPPPLPADKRVHTKAFVTPVVEHWPERVIAQWVHYEGSIRQPIACTPWNK